MLDPSRLRVPSPRTRRPTPRSGRAIAPDPEALRAGLARLADAVLLQAVTDAQDVTHSPANTRADAAAFLTATSGPWAASRQTWLRLAGRRGR